MSYRVGGREARSGSQGEKRISLEQFRVGLIHPSDHQSLKRSKRSLLQRGMKSSASSVTGIQAGVFDAPNCPLWGVNYTTLKQI